MDAATKAISLGHPSYIWGFGQERRLAIVRRHVALENARILDVGCGVGAYVEAFRRFSPFVYGVDVDQEKVDEAKANLPNLAVAPAEDLPYKSNYFDVVYLHEVIEHVNDDRQALAEAVRVTRPGGHVVVFAPNRLYPFETHGFYLGEKHVFKLLPFVNYFPDPVRDRFCPHVRVYSSRAMRKLFNGLPVNLDVHTQVFPAFDGVARSKPVVALALRRFLYAAEETPFCAFGLSHFVVASKVR